jgi:TonB family protein
MRPIILGLIILGGGAVSIAGAYFEWKWFMGASNARPIVELLGRKGARIFYAALGVVLLACGTLFAAGVFRLPPGVSVQNVASGVRLPSGGTRRILKSVAPEYPASLRQKGIGGEVIVRIWIQPDGTVAGTQIRSSPSDELSALAMTAVRQWVFEESRDTPAMTVEIPVMFSVDK